MATKKISELSELTSLIASGDEIIINHDGATKRVKASLLQESLVSIFAESGGAGLHNSIYRGKNLGSTFTAEQKAQIAAGTFNNMWIGDHWVINGITWRIAHFDYWLNCGDTACNSHHVLIVPDSCLYSAQFNESNVTTGAYVGSKMYTENLEQAKTIINNAFGSPYILNHRELLSNTTSSGRASNWSWYDSKVEIMNENMVYGCSVGSKPIDDSINFNVGIDKVQLALFRLAPQFICNRAHWWLRSVVSAAYFAGVGGHGDASDAYASASLGVRPAFAITA